ncbi:hypothetical protein Q1695_009092 [Nippostrongylus brasiliensis]|nr:hypothetical protein Q1695_009092 [Nippostrongylus brasiliensis]
MSSEKEGWLSSVTRLFSTGRQSDTSRVEDASSSQDSQYGSSRIGSPRHFLNGGSTPAQTFESSAQPRSLRYLSPSVLESGISKPSVSKPVPTEDIFVMTSTTSRKRALTQDRPATAMDCLINSRDNPKRSRREQLASSMLEDMTPNMFSDRLSSTWMGRPSDDSSSRIGSNRSNSSSLSSKTRAILNHLERINTPAREARKLPVMRGSTVPSERWAPLHSGAPPPLLRTSATVPSRIQLLSSSLASRRKPYWRDITRKVENEKNDVIIEANDSTSVQSLFGMAKNGTQETGKAIQKEAEMPSKTSEPTTKDSAVTRSEVSNVFNTTELDNDNVIDSTGDKTVDQLMFAPPVKAKPSVGLYDDVVFSFEPPVKRAPGQNLTSTVLAGNNQDGSDDSEDSGSDDSDNDQSSSTSDAEETTEQDKCVKTSRPPTAADSETSGAASSVVTPTSSKDVSPQSKVESSWECPDCFISNKNVTACVACGHQKDGANGSKTLVSNISTMAKPTTGGFRFGFSSDAKTADSSASTSTTKATASCEGGSVVSISVPAPSAPAPVLSKTESVEKPAATEIPSSVADTNAPAEKKRAPWECPDCMVQNKESDDKCVCCGHVKYKSGGDSAATASVFGDRAFKAAPLPSTGVSFGFGAASTSSTMSGIKFGFGSTNDSSSTKLQEPAVATPVTTSTLTLPPISKAASSPAFNSLTENGDATKTQAPSFSLGAGATIFGAGAKPPLFGSSSTSMFNAASSTGPSLTAPSSSTSASLPASTAPPLTKEPQPSSLGTPAPFVFGAAQPAANSKPFGLFESKKAESAVNSVPSFGSGVSLGAATAPLASAQVSSSSTAAGEAPNADTAAKSILGTTGASLFGASAAPKPLFGSFGSTNDATKSFLGGSSNSTAESFKPLPFGASLAGSNEASKASPFGGAATKPLFGSNTTTTVPAANGGLSFSFGSSSNTFSGFGTNSSSSATIPTSTSSTTSIFGSASAAEPAKPFQFSATVPEPTFQFGQSTGFGTSAPFQFGSSQTPAAPAFQMPGITAPAPAAPSSNFSFTSSGPRKMVAARRRLPQRK